MEPSTKKEMSNNMEALQHYIDRFKKIMEEEQLITPGKKLIVLLSGGTDSSALTKLLEAYRKTNEHIQPHYLNVLYPFDLYGKDLKKRQALIGEGLEHYTSIIPTAEKNTLALAKNPCQTCKDIRSDAIANALKEENKENLIIMTGHTQDDIYAYFAEITGLDLRAAIEKPDYNKLGTIDITIEHLEHLSRFYKKLVLEDGVTLIKPLLAFNNKEINDVLTMTKSKKHATCCLYYCARPKRNLFHIMKLLPEQETQAIYEATKPEQLLQAIKEHAHNYSWAENTIKHKPYTSLLL